MGCWKLDLMANWTSSTEDNNNNSNNNHKSNNNNNYNYYKGSSHWTFRRNQNIRAIKKQFNFTLLMYFRSLNKVLIKYFVLWVRSHYEYFYFNLINRRYPNYSLIQAPFQLWYSRAVVTAQVVSGAVLETWAHMLQGTGLLQLSSIFLAAYQSSSVNIVLVRFIENIRECSS